MDRRSFLQASSISLIATSLASPAAMAAQQKAVRPPKLKSGDTVVLVSPASAVFEKDALVVATESLQAMGLKVVHAKHVLDRYGYLAGTDKDRADDINKAFADPSIDGIVALRGGWGCNRILPYLDYSAIAKNPKVLLGYSDITSLLNAIYAKTGLVSFHGPVGISYWGEFQADQLHQTLFAGNPVTMRNYREDDGALVMRSNRAHTVVKGKATGTLVGGNLTVLTSLVGTPYLPDMRGKILMLEDVEESIYRIDRYFSTLQLAGILDQVAGIVFGHCSDCEPQKGYGGFTLTEILEHYLTPLSVPSYVGAQFGHIRNNHILPVGLEVVLDASSQTLTPVMAPVV